MTREREPSGPVLQRAYGVLDKYKISRTFFVETDQKSCETTAEPEEVEENSNPGYDIVVDDEEVLNEYYNGVPATASQGYYRQNKPMAKENLDKKGEQAPPKIDAAQAEGKNKPALDSGNVAIKAPANASVSSPLPTDQEPDDIPNEKKTQ